MIPGEAAIIALANLFTEIIKGQTMEQKAILWQQWIEFWRPIMPKGDPR